MSGVSPAMFYALCGAAMIGAGLYGFIACAHLLRRIVAFNVIGSGLFLYFGALGHRGVEPVTDPVPQALVITGIVVALSLTALAVALVLRLAKESGSAVLPGEVSDDPGARARAGGRR